METVVQWKLVAKMCKFNNFKAERQNQLRVDIL